MKLIQYILVAMLLLCLAPMPYGYYMLVRWTAFAGFAYIGWQFFESEESKFTWVFWSLALLFQPFYKVALGRPLWNIVDVLVAGLLLYMIFKGNNPRNSS